MYKLTYINDEGKIVISHKWLIDKEYLKKYEDHDIKLEWINKG